MSTKRTCRLFAVAVAFTLLFSCFQMPLAISESSGAADRPVLKVLNEYAAFDPATDPGCINIAEVTGFEVEYYLLPSQNSNEALMLDLAGGSQYDCLILNTAHFQMASSSGALMALDELIAERGSWLLDIPSAMAWDSVKGADGKIYAVPSESGGASVNNPYGAIQGGILVREDKLAEAGLELPKTVEEFENMLKVFKEMNGGEAPWTGNATFMFTLASAFGLTNSVWQERDGKLVHRMETPEMREYLTWLKGLYDEGYMDPEWPVNRAEHIREKFATGKAYMSLDYFWNADIYMNALQANFPDASYNTMVNLYDKNGKQLVAVAYGLNATHSIPKASKNAEHVIDFVLAKSDPDNFVKTYIGYEGDSYEIIDGKYWPILPRFNDFNNVSWFVGTSEPSYSYMLWQCRARKTDNIAKMYADMNDPVFVENQAYELYIDPANYAASIPDVANNAAATTQYESDMYNKLLFGGESFDNYDALVAQWRALEGGDAMTEAINEWYTANYDLIQQLGK